MSWFRALLCVFAVRMLRLRYVVVRVRLLFYVYVICVSICVMRVGCSCSLCVWASCVYGVRLYVCMRVRMHVCVSFLFHNMRVPCTIVVGALARWRIGVRLWLAHWRVGALACWRVVVSSFVLCFCLYVFVVRMCCVMIWL